MKTCAFSFNLFIQVAVCQCVWICLCILVWEYVCARSRCVLGFVFVNLCVCVCVCGFQSLRIAVKLCAYCIQAFQVSGNENDKERCLAQRHSCFNQPWPVTSAARCLSSLCALTLGIVHGDVLGLVMLCSSRSGSNFLKCQLLESLSQFRNANPSQ